MEVAPNCNGQATLPTGRGEEIEYRGLQLRTKSTGLDIIGINNVIFNIVIDLAHTAAELSTLHSTGTRDLTASIGMCALQFPGIR